MSKIIATSTETDSEIVLVKQRKRFPWWILLFLLLLVFLIPIPRNINIQFLQDGNPVANNPANVVYPEISTFGSHTDKPVSGQTNAEGIMAIGGITEPLWHWLFAAKDSLDVMCENGCSGLAARYSYQKFAKEDINRVTLAPNTISTTLTVVNKETGAPLPDARVRIVVGGVEQEVVSNASGIVSIHDVSACADISVTASKEGFKDDSMVGKASDIKAKPDSERKLRLEPIKPPDPPKPPKQDPPKVDPPKPPKVDPPKQDPPQEAKKEDPPAPPLRGQKGELRINLSWDCKADLDIYVTDPCGNQLGPRNKRRTCNGSTGTIDIDANQDATNHPENARTDPQENVFWSKANPGRYRIQINCCPLNRRMNLSSTTIPFTIVIEDRGKRTVKQGRITGAYDNGLSDDKILRDFWIYEVTE